MKSKNAINIINTSEFELHHFQIQKIKNLCMYFDNVIELTDILNKLLIYTNGQTNNYKILILNLNNYDIINICK